MKVLLVIGMFAGLVGGVAAQVQEITELQQLNGQPGQPPQPVIGKGTISGTVVNSRTHEPIRKARVMLSGAANLTATTDSGGNFAFHSLPAGTYWMMANHEDLFANPLTGGNTSQVVLADGDEKTGIEIPLQPGATITGHVTNEDGDPVQNCNVSATRSDRSQGFLRPGGMWGANTDAEGSYRIHGLMAGRYVIRAQCGETFPAPHGFMPRGDPMIPQEGYAPVTYGGGASAGAASSGGTVISAGADLTAVDFHVTRVPMFLVRGTLSGVDASQLNNVQLNLIPHDNPAAEQTPVPTHMGAQRGQFRFRNVVAGSYDLIATVISNDRAWEARETIEVGKNPVTDFELKLVPGPTLSGSVRVEDPALNLSGMQLALTPLTPNYRGPFPTANIAADGTFVFKSILPGHFRFNGLQNGAYAKSFSLGGRDVSPDDFEISDGAAGPLIITAGNKPGTVEVSVESPPAGGTAINALLVPEPSGVPRVSGTTVGSGPVTLQFPGVPPGKYRVLLLATQNAWLVGNSADILKQLESRSVTVEVTEGGDQRVSASVVPEDDLQKAMEAAE